MLILAKSVLVLLIGFILSIVTGVVLIPIDELEESTTVTLKYVENDLYNEAITQTIVKLDKTNTTVELTLSDDRTTLNVAPEDNVTISVVLKDQYGDIIPNKDVTITITNVDEDNENKVSFEMTTTANVTGESNLTVIYDYGYSPEKDSEGNKLNAGNPTSMRYYVLDAKSLASMDSKVKVNVNALSNWDEDAQAQIDKVVEFELEDFYNNKAIQAV